MLIKLIVWVSTVNLQHWLPNNVLFIYSHWSHATWRWRSLWTIWWCLAYIVYDWKNSNPLFHGFCWPNLRGWLGGAKVLCILHHRGVQLILAYSWARPAILVVGKGRGGMFLFLLFLHFHSCSSFFPVPLFHLLYSLFYLFSPFLWETTQNDPQGLTCR